MEERIDDEIEPNARSPSKHIRCSSGQKTRNNGQTASTPLRNVPIHFHTQKQRGKGRRFNLYEKQGENKSGWICVTRSYYVKIGLSKRTVYLQRLQTVSCYRALCNQGDGGYYTAIIE